MSDDQTTHSVNPMRARPTIYRGIQMRSRLEAKFAARLDHLGVEWTYEPKCYADASGQYLPDFWVEIAGEPPLCIEVKPTQALASQWLDGPMRVVWASEAATLVGVWFENDPYEPGWRTSVRCPSTNVFDWFCRTTPDHKPWIFPERIEATFSGTSVTIDIIPEAEFSPALLEHWGRPGGKWHGPDLKAADGWHLVTPSATSTPYWPPFIEVDANGIVTDTYSGQYFVTCIGSDILEQIVWMR